MAHAKLLAPGLIASLCFLQQASNGPIMSPQLFVDVEIRVKAQAEGWYLRDVLTLLAHLSGRPMSKRLLTLSQPQLAPRGSRAGPMPITARPERDIRQSKGSQ